ncbi:toll/interleukin-1 receptor domain-containing protein [Actinoplanes sp. G11-F43]|uniref:toll/interleukin-1 receptor domain-containing protein n=1 Tax=Actinoplanes sp. G11-F43 TaxID=3424130 RepID=UPI003D32E24E
MPVLVSHAPADEPWAQWIAASLRAAGHQVHLDPADGTFAARLTAGAPDDGPVLLLLSAEHRATITDWTLLTEAPALAGRLIALCLDAAGAPGALHPIPCHSLHGLDEEDAIETLLTLAGGIPRRISGDPGLRPTAGW